MSFNYINKLLIVLLIPIIFSCQDILESNALLENNIYDQNNSEIKEVLDLDFYMNTESNIFDYYTHQLATYDFTKKTLKKIKLKSHLDNLKEPIPLNLIYDEIYLYSLSSNGTIIKHNKDTGKIIEEIPLGLNNSNKIHPISFSLINDSFIIGFKTGEIIKSSKKGELIWSFKEDNFLNTPLKITNDYIVVLYPEEIILLSPDSGTVIFRQNYKDRNIIQSNGGKFVSFFNFLYFILPNSAFGSIDTFFYEKNISKLDSLQIQTSLNNLNDNLHIYKNFLVYLDNGNQLNTFDIMEDKFLLKNYLLNNIKSYAFFNNSLVVLKNNYIEFYNIKNGKILFLINLDKTLNNNSEIIKIININNKLHIFFDTGKVVIIEKREILEVVDLKIRDINYIYNINSLFFVSTRKGITYIY
tara:strand:+ start:453 stop:1691 length:1239 start_codon:yes stop_codon:yes gene_type:complete